MKVAIISDVHGNRLALEAVLDDIARQGVDATFNLGDLVSGPLEPNWTADILMDLDFPTVRGNHERALIEKPPEKLSSVDRFAQEQMEVRHRIWINDMPATMSLLDDVFLCHGTPTSDEDPWLDSWWDGRTVTTPDEGMAFVALPARTDPHVRLTPERGSSRRPSTAGTCVITWPSANTTSAVRCGRDVWPPGPRNVT